MSILTRLASLASAGMMLLSVPLDTAAPQNDADGTLFLVNRQWEITESFVPANLQQAEVPGQVRRMRAEAAAALEEMFAACKAEAGVTLISISGYRPFSTQANLYSRKLRSVRNDVAKAQEYVAPPGTSEHQLGLAMDIGQRNKAHLDQKFADTEGARWAWENCWRFGFILRYGKDWEDITGYKYESWHFRYVGKEKAKEIHDAQIPMETWLIQYRQELLTRLLREGEK